jgi:hypothetical protein
MEKTITIDGKDILFKTNGALPLRYKTQFNKDYFKEIIRMSPLGNLDPQNLKSEDLELVDFEVFYNIAWVMAKTADPSIPDPIKWLETFDEFPIVEIFPQLQSLMESSFKTTKKN